MPELNKGEPMNSKPATLECPVCKSKDTSIYNDKNPRSVAYVCDECGDMWVVENPK